MAGLGMWSGGSPVSLSGGRGVPVVPWVQGPRASEVAGGAGEGREREGHGTMRLRQCWGRGLGGLTLLLDGVKFMFFLWK